MSKTVKRAKDMSMKGKKKKPSMTPYIATKKKRGSKKINPNDLLDEMELL